MKSWIEKFEAFMMRDDLSDTDIVVFLAILGLAFGAMAFLLSP